MHQEQLFDMVRRKTSELLNHYVSHEMVERRMEDYIVPPGLGENPGILGAVRLGILEWEKEKGLTQ